MSIFEIAVLVGVSVLLLLGAVAVMARKQQKGAERRHQARLFKRRIQDLTEALEFLMNYDGNKELQRAILLRIDQLVKKHTSLSGGGSVANGLPDIAQLQQVIESGKARRSKILKSTSEMRFAKRQISQILKSLPVLQKTRSISESALLEYRRYLNVFLVEMEVDSLVAQGDAAAQRSEMTTAVNYYKAARKRLVEFKVRYPEKEQKIDMIKTKMSELFKSSDKQVDDGDKEKERENLSPKDKKEKKKEAGEPAREESIEVDENGFPLDPMNMMKQKF